MLYLIWRPVASILPATPFLPTPPLQLSSSLLPPSPPHLPLHTRACPTIVHIYIFISRLSHTQSQTAKSRSRVSSQPACVHYTVLLCALWLMWNDGTVVLSSSSSFSSYLKSFHVSDIKLILQLSEKISVWYCETAEETTECVLNRYHTRPKLAVPSVQQLIQCMRESVIPAKTFPVTESLWCFPMKTEELQWLWPSQCAAVLLATGVNSKHKSENYKITDTLKT